MTVDINLQLARKGFLLDLKVSITNSGITAIFGRSGSGKTTLLRCIAGLEQAKGDLTVDGDDWQSSKTFVPAYQRAVGYVFQQPNLFSFMSIEKNLQYGYTRVPETERTIPFSQAVDLLNLDQLLGRRPEQLSGGQQQRVAIARALLSSPRLLLLDEPLSSLDQESKSDILPYIERLNKNLGIPVLYVSHAAGELTRLADDMILLDQGKMLAFGTINKVLTDTDLPLAYRDDASTVLLGTVKAQDSKYHLSKVAMPGGEISVPSSNLPVGTTLRIRIFARDISLALIRPELSSIQNILRGKIVSINNTGDPAQALIQIKLIDSSSNEPHQNGSAPNNIDVGQPNGSEQYCLSRITQLSVATLNLRVGTELYLQVKSVAVVNSYH
jgi:molybdate transport system ATP-binding protein